MSRFKYICVFVFIWASISSIKQRTRNMGLFVKVEGRILFVRNIKEAEHMLMFKKSLCLVQNIAIQKSQNKTNKKKTCFTFFFLEANLAWTADRELAGTASWKHWSYKPPASTWINNPMHKLHCQDYRSGSFLGGNACTSSVLGQKVKGNTCPMKPKRS